MVRAYRWIKITTPPLCVGMIIIKIVGTKGKKKKKDVSQCDGVSEQFLMSRTLTERLRDMITQRANGITFCAHRDLAYA